MAATAQATGVKDHRLLVAALVVLGGATGAAFGRVFQGRPASVRLIAAGAFAVLLAELLRRRNVLLSVAVSAAGLLVALGVMVLPATTWYGLPTLETIRALGASLGSLGRQAAEEIAPAPPLPSLLAASITAVWAASAAAHALAIRSRSTILPILPPAALLAFAGVVVGDGPRPGYATALLLAAAAVLLGVGVERLGLWGRVVHRRARTTLVGGPTLRRAASIGISALFVALVLPGLLPGYSDDALIAFGGGQGEGVTITPIVDIRPSLRQNPPAHLFTVQAPRPAYWRMVALDRFDGLVWSATDLYAEEGAAVEGSETLTGSTTEGQSLTQLVEIHDLATKWLPAAFEPQEVTVDGDIRYAPQSGMLVRPEGVVDGFTYRVTSKLHAPTSKELDAEVLPSSLDLGGYLELPANLPADIGRIAQNIVDRAGATTMYQKALAIQEHLRTFRYDAAIPQGHANKDLLEFLLTTRRGYCEQFAGAMAVMLRTLGIPSRVAIGFRPGDEVTEGNFLVSSQDAHAWPEVFFGDLGWIQFEPTPTRANPVGRYLESGGTPGTPEGPGPPEAQNQPQGREGQRFNADESAQTASREAAAAAPPPIRIPPPEPEVPWGRLVLAGLATLAVVMLEAGVAKSLARRLALRDRAPGGVGRAYRVFQATAADLGVPRRRAETLGEYRDRLRSSVLLTDGHLDRLTELTATTAYGPRPPTAEQERAAVRAARGVSRDLRRHVGVGRRLVAAARPTPPY